MLLRSTVPGTALGGFPGGASPEHSRSGSLVRPPQSYYESTKLTDRRNRRMQESGLSLSASSQMRPRLNCAIMKSTPRTFLCCGLAAGVLLFSSGPTVADAAAARPQDLHPPTAELITYPAPGGIAVFRARRSTELPAQLLCLSGRQHRARAIQLAGARVEHPLRAHDSMDVFRFPKLLGHFSETRVNAGSRT